MLFILIHEDQVTDDMHLIFIHNLLVENKFRMIEHCLWKWHYLFTRLDKKRHICFYTYGIYVRLSVRLCVCLFMWVVYSSIALAAVIHDGVRSENIMCDRNN